MEDKKNIWDLEYDGSKTIRILPTTTSHGKTMPYYIHKYWISEEDRKRDLRKRKIKNILNEIDV